MGLKSRGTDDLRLRLMDGMDLSFAIGCGLASMTRRVNAPLRWRYGDCWFWGARRGFSLLAGARLLNGFSSHRGSLNRDRALEFPS